MILQETDSINQNGENQNYAKLFRNAKTPEEEQNVIAQFCANFGFASYNADDWNTFIKNNLNSLHIECTYYGLNKDNPFFMFLQQYSVQNHNIKAFLVTGKYNILHNLLSNNQITEKQLNWTCSEQEQIRILLNPNLWGVSPLSDISYLIRVYCDIVSDNLTYYIRNDYIINTLTGGNPATINSTTVRICLLKCIFFTEYIAQLYEAFLNNDSQKSEEIKNKILALKGDGYRSLVSGEFNSADSIEHQINILSETSQRSGRAADGRFQRDTGKENPREEEYSQFTNQQLKVIKQNAPQIVNQIKTTFGVKSNAAARDLLKALADVI